ncbi:hypothetical protein KBD20_00055 [Candidatus Saccharibacteria bacterium]|nr:hypothetical protein [Candidatus Saccharibacteria bacterium]
MNHETQKILEKPSVPKSREIFSGDINDAVIAVQQITGFEITPEWWITEVGNDGPTEDILDRFDVAFERLVQSEMGFESADSSEESMHITKEMVLDEAEQELAHFDQSITDPDEADQLRPEFIQELSAHLKEKYYPSVTTGPETADSETFSLTDPKERVYTPDEVYRFLVHVPLGDVAHRAAEIGHERGDTKLMTSLISNKHQGTFSGEGGILVAQPSEDSVSGVAYMDVGGEIQGDRRDKTESIIEPAAPSEYNQIDMAFDGTTPIGVLIKQSPDGRRLGSPERNEDLIAYAEQNNLPVVIIEVQPEISATETSVITTELPDSKGEMVTVDVPYSSTEFFRTQVLRIGESNKVYHADGENSVARTMKVNQYGEATQELSVEDEQFIIDRLTELSADGTGRLTDEDLGTIERDLARLKDIQ